MRSVQKTPAAMVENGKTHYGIFDKPFAKVNALDANPFGLAGALLPKTLRNLRLKEWQHYSIITKTHFFGVAVVNAKFMGASWCYAVSRETGELIEHSLQSPLTKPAVPRELFDARFSFKATGYAVEVHNQLSAGRHALSFDAATKAGPAIKGDLTIDESAKVVQPLVGVIPLNTGGFFYTHKVPCPIEGTISIGGEEIAVDPKTDFAILDIHKAYYPYRTWWQWATFAGRDKKGKLLGGNFTRGLHGTTETHNENCIWHGNRMSLFSDVVIETQEDIMAPWKLHTTDGRADLTFTPVGIRQETLDYKLFVSWYRAPVGTFAGTMTDDDGVVHEVNDLFGIAEHHRVTW